MTFPRALPHLDLGAFDRLVVSYDSESDVLVFHVGPPRAAVGSNAGDGWYLRLVDDEIASVEVHGLQRTMVQTPSLTASAKPAILELERAAGRSLFRADSDGIRVEGSSDDLPMTARFVILLAGQAMARHEALKRSAYAEASRGALSAACD